MLYENLLQSFSFSFASILVFDKQLFFYAADSIKEINDCFLRNAQHCDVAPRAFLLLGYHNKLREVVKPVSRAKRCMKAVVNSTGEDYNIQKMWNTIESLNQLAKWKYRKQPKPDVCHYALL